MRESFGPWTSGIDTGSVAQLNAFWKQRLACLPSGVGPPARLSRGRRLGALAAIALLLAVPTWELSPSRVAASVEGTGASDRDQGQRGVSQSVRAEDVPVADERSVRIELPGDGIVELAAVTENPSRGKPWWTPSGLPTAPLYDRAPANVRDGNGFLSREVVLRWIRRPKDDTAVIWSVRSSGSGGGGTPMDAAGKRVANLNVSVGSFPLLERTCVVSFRIAAGPWKSVGDTDGRSLSAVGGPKFGLTFSPAHEANGGVNLPVAHDMTNVDLRAVAIDRDGAETVSAAPSSVGARGVQLTLFQFHKVALADVRSFRIESRAYTTIEVRDVSLAPGHLTTPRVVRFEAAEGNDPSRTSTADSAALGRDIRRTIRAARRRG